GAALRSRAAPHPQRRALRPPSATPHVAPPLYGLLELPAGEFEGPPNGLTLDQAIERLLRANPDLRSKRFELPQARADVLTASQRPNPLYFLSANNVPYQPYSTGRWGAMQYSPSFVQPFDVGDKRGARTKAASQAVRVLEAQYQNAERLAVHELYLAYTDVIVARETHRYAEISLAGAKALYEASRGPARDQAVSESDHLHLTIQYETARLDVDRARSELLRAKHRLGTLLAMPRPAAARLKIRGRLRPPEPPLPGREELVAMALATRPDVRAYRLGVGRAQADAHVARKERFDDVFVVYSPFQFQYNVPIGKQDVTSFSLGLMGSIPIFDRNQGEILRADTNVAQSRAATAAIEGEVAAEVETALVEYHDSRQAVERIEQTILPASERAKLLAHQKHQAGQASTTEYLFALRDRNEVVRQYRDALIRHRRGMLQLNTTVGRRVLP
ncbi:MAG TPA: TolC family protein, partial [Pirellulales bacterium]|nr:TolC family protein [Pirellulales bacterium]